MSQETRWVAGISWGGLPVIEQVKCSVSAKSITVARESSASSKILNFRTRLRPDDPRFLKSWCDAKQYLRKLLDDSEQNLHDKIQELGMQRRHLEKLEDPSCPN